MAIPFDFKFASGRLPSGSELARLLGPRAKGLGAAVPHWLDNFAGGPRGRARSEGVGLIELCLRFQSIELWIDPDPSAQLMLLKLLDFLRSDAEVVGRLFLCQANVMIGNMRSEALAEWRPPAVKVANDHLEAASLAWRAYSQPTPQDWFDLLRRDLSVLRQLGQAVLELLEELPMAGTGLGATETRILELISKGDAGPYDVFPGHRRPNKRGVFGYWEIGSLLDGLADCSAPAVSGLEEGPFTLDMHEDRDRHRRYKRSKLKLTALGKSVLARTEDFSRHNPIHRWWGGTELRNERLWRWDPANRALIAP